MQLLHTYICTYVHSFNYRVTYAYTYTVAMIDDYRVACACMQIGNYNIT